MPDLTVIIGLAGARIGGHAGNAVSSETMYSALQPLGELLLLNHHTSVAPSIRKSRENGDRVLELGTQPLLVHGEAAAAAYLHREQLREMSCAWAVNSRYAGSLDVAGIPYAIWEPTTLRDELAATSAGGVRRAGRGTGLGTVLHRLSMPLDARLERRLYNNATVLCTMSEYARERIAYLHGISRDRIEVLLHPPSRAFLETLAEKRKAPVGSERGSGPARLLFVGRVDDPRKNFPLLVSAFQLLRVRQPGTTLTVVGPYTEAWRAGIDLQDKRGIRFLGSVSLNTLVEAYLNHDLLVLTSRQEGFGIVVAEAMHAALPVVATQCGGPDAIIIRSGGGCSVKASAPAISDAIEGVLADDERYNAMKQAAREFAVSELSQERFEQRVRQLTNQLLTAAKRS